MKDRFKFRAWDECNKIMHYDFQFIKDWSNGGWIIFQSDKQKLDWETNEKFTVNVYPNPYFAEQLKIMQSTGLKDKNGKLIFEGDVVKLKTELFGKPKQIIWDECHYILKDTFIILCNMEIKQFGLEVIGNIYENPKLLKECGNE